MEKRYGILVGEGGTVLICGQASLFEKLTTESKELKEVREWAMRTIWVKNHHEVPEDEATRMKVVEMKLENCREASC